MSWGEIDNAWAFLAVLAAQLAGLFAVIYGQHKGRTGRSADREVIAQAAAKVDTVSAKVDVVRQDVQVVRGEVKNDHPDNENLRDQLDRMEHQNKLLTNMVVAQGAMLQEIQDRQDDQGREIRGLRQDVGGLHGEDRAAQSAHNDLVRRLNAFIRREHPGADPL